MLKLVILWNSLTSVHCKSLNIGWTDNVSLLCTLWSRTRKRLEWKQTNDPGVGNFDCNLLKFYCHIFFVCFRIYNDKHLKLLTIFIVHFLLQLSLKILINLYEILKCFDTHLSKYALLLLHVYYLPSSLSITIPTLLPTWGTSCVPMLVGYLLSPTLHIFNSCRLV